MVCAACPPIGFVFGWIAGYLGVKAPDSPKARVMSALMTSGITVVTVVALKVIFGISVCDGQGNFSLTNIAQVGAITFVMGTIYAIAVNTLFSYWQAPPKKGSCCHGV